MRTISLSFLSPLKPGTDFLRSGRQDIRGLLPPSNRTGKQERHIMIRERELLGPLGAEVRRAWWL